MTFVDDRTPEQRKTHTVRCYRFVVNTWLADWNDFILWARDTHPDARLRVREGEYSHTKIWLYSASLLAAEALLTRLIITYRKQRGLYKPLRSLLSD